ncbi:unnamed protein product [Schistosoma margrebowiei]|uniref:Uncharacterized protein n=1 Tax=Schistosoma margrebowiei TaxID=48269 RepID=A0A183LJB5_9TREM|nr:unnamed protein product [Schistosoma margrebowiei]
MRRLFDLTKNLARKYGKPEWPVRDKVRKPITEIQEQKNIWVEHIEELSKRPASMKSPDIETAHTDLPIIGNSPTIEGVRTVIRQIRSGKAVRPDNAPPEALKSHVKSTAKMLHILLKKSS